MPDLVYENAPEISSSAPSDPGSTPFGASSLGFLKQFFPDAKIPDGLNSAAQIGVPSQPSNSGNVSAPSLEDSLLGGMSGAYGDIITTTTNTVSNTTTNFDDRDTTIVGFNSADVTNLLNGFTNAVSNTYQTMLQGLNRFIPSVPVGGNVNSPNTINDGGGVTDWSMSGQRTGGGQTVATVDGLNLGGTVESLKGYIVPAVFLFVAYLALKSFKIIK